MPNPTLGELFTQVMEQVPTSQEVSTKYTKPANGIPATDLANGVIPDTSGFLTQHQDISGLAPKANPDFTGSISMMRLSNSTIGSNSVALGASGAATIASGDGAVALGGATASALLSFAAGPSATASSYGTSAIGFHATASNSYAHATGSYTVSSGVASLTGGQYTIANHASQYALGQYNVADTSNAEADARGTYIEIIGNGNDANSRSNARVLDWDGNEYLKGNLYVGCNSNSTDGSKVATEAFVTTRIPAPPVADGNYILKVNVSSGTATYSWVALSDLSGVTF